MYGPTWWFLISEVTLYALHYFDIKGGMQNLLGGSEHCLSDGAGVEGWVWHSGMNS